MTGSFAHRKTRPSGKFVPLGIDEFDATWSSGPGDFIHDREITIDLSSISYFRLESLPFLLGVFDDRGGRGLETLLELPSSVSVIDWLRAWKLPEALEIVTGRPFERLLTARSKARFRGISRTPSIYEEPVMVGQSKEDPHAPGLETLLPKGFFALTQLILDFDPEEAAWSLRHKWLASHVQGVLERYLKDDPEFLATDVIYEAVLNAATHAKARIGFSACQMRRHSSGPMEGRPKDLEIVIWDNGLSFVDTLRAALERPEGIRASTYPENDVSMLVQIMDDGVVAEDFTLYSDSDEVDATDHGLALSAFFKGVTSSPLGNDRNAVTKLTPAVSWPTGNGLYQVREAVIDGYGGSIRYIAGRDRIVLRALTPATNAERTVGRTTHGQYFAKVDRKGSRSAHLPGNLLILRLPFSSNAPDIPSRIG